MPWYGLAVYFIIGAYFAWIGIVMVRCGLPSTDFEDKMLAATILCLYWAVIIFFFVMGIGSYFGFIPSY